MAKRNRRGPRVFAVITALAALIWLLQGHIPVPALKRLQGLPVTIAALLALFGLLIWVHAKVESRYGETVARLIDIVAGLILAALIITGLNGWAFFRVVAGKLVVALLNPVGLFTLSLLTVLILLWWITRD